MSGREPRVGAVLGAALEGRAGAVLGAVRAGRAGAVLGAARVAAGAVRARAVEAVADVLVDPAAAGRALRRLGGAGVSRRFARARGAAGPGDTPGPTRAGGQAEGVETRREGAGRAAGEGEGAGAGVAPRPDVASTAAAEVARLQAVLDAEVNPKVASHGGEIRVVELRGDDVCVTMGGGCQGCAAAALTLRAGVEKALRAAYPRLRDLVDVTDHAAGTRPYAT